MAIYFQHVGEAGGKRDFPQTIGTERTGLRYRTFDETESFLDHLSMAERSTIQEATTKFEDGFQIWGIPTGAKFVLRSLKVGDYLLLLESITAGGVFAYARRVVARPSQECHDLSRFLWGELRFPLIVFMRGALTRYMWYDFCEEFNFKKNWDPRGLTYRLKPERIRASSFGDERAVIAAIGGQEVLP